MSVCINSLFLCGASLNGREWNINEVNNKTNRNKIWQRIEEAWWYDFAKYPRLNAFSKQAMFQSKLCCKYVQFLNVYLLWCH